MEQGTAVNILDRSFAELEQDLTQLGEPPFRARQVWQWLWQKQCRDFSGMTNISLALRRKLSEGYVLKRPVVEVSRISRDATVKMLLRLADGCLIETVLIPEKDHYTQCLSTQVGCPLACCFCSTGRMGFKRNLSSGEILGQVLVGIAYLEEMQCGLQLRNIVYMGMGEPLFNWEQVKKSLTILGDPRGLNFSHRRVTVSSVGVPGKLQEFAETGLGSLAVSLHAPNQELRARIMPRAAALLSVDALLQTLQSLPLKSRQRITIEYILLGGVNDALEQARDLNRLLSFLRCKINLIAFNPDPKAPYHAPAPEQILAFEQYLWDKGLTVNLRKSKGADIQAACGQLIAAEGSEQGA